MPTSPVFFTPEGREAVLAYQEKLFTHLTVPHTQQMVSTRYGDTYVTACGDVSAPPIVLLHGSSINSSMWISDMQKLSTQYRVYALDLPGEPGRSAENQLPFETNDYAHWLADVMDGLSVQSATIMGASLGAWLSIQFAVHYPRRVDALVLLCPAGVGPQNGAFKDIAMSLLSKGEAGADELLALINGGPMPEIIRNYQKLIASTFNARKEPIPIYTDEELAALTMPTLMLMGEHDIMLDAKAAAARYSQLVPTAQVKLLPDKGHSLTGFTDQIMAFLANSKGSPASF